LAKRCIAVFVNRAFAVKTESGKRDFALFAAVIAVIDRDGNWG
jgi:hypothetical protein